jgi:hypothetical protein
MFLSLFFPILSHIVLGSVNRTSKRRANYQFPVRESLARLCSLSRGDCSSYISLGDFSVYLLDELSHWGAIGAWGS